MQLLHSLSAKHDAVQNELQCKVQCENKRLFEQGAQRRNGRATLSLDKTNAPLESVAVTVWSRLGECKCEFEFWGRLDEPPGFCTRSARNELRTFAVQNYGLRLRICADSLAS